MLLRPEEDWSCLRGDGGCAISSGKHAKADRAERLQRSESCFAFIWDFVGNLNGRHETLICLNKKPHRHGDPGTLWHISLNHTHIHTHIKMK